MVKGGAPQCAIKTHVAAGKTYSCRRHQPRSFDNPRTRGKHGNISRYGLRCNSRTHEPVGNTQVLGVATDRLANNPRTRGKHYSSNLASDNAKRQPTKSRGKLRALPYPISPYQKLTYPQENANRYFWDSNDNPITHGLAGSIALELISIN